MLNPLPTPGKKYLVKILHPKGKVFHTVAAYWPKFTQEGHYDEFEGDLDYNEDNDTYYWPEGWYENQYTPDTNWLITDRVIAYMEVPVESEDWEFC